MSEKYRFYHRSLDKVYPVDNIHWDEDGNIDEIVLWDKDGNDIIESNLSYGVLMRSIGLFDKNDVEIFEGDILECENIPNEVKWLETVHWNEEKAQFVSREIEANIQRDTELYSLLSPTFMSIRVIDNLYENPELVEVNK